MFCDQCGSEIPHIALFCQHCGSSAKVPAPSPAYVQLQTSRTIKFPDALRLGFQNYFQFKGRSGRSEFWWFIFFQQTCLFGGIISPGPIIGPVVWLGLIIPAITVTTRRLHDVGLSGWWQIPFILGLFVSLIGALFLFLYPLFALSGEISALKVLLFLGSGFLIFALISLSFIGIKVLSKDGAPWENRFGYNPKLIRESITPGN